MATTQTQLRDIALRYDREIADVHTSALEGVGRSGQAQIEAADELRRVIQRALTDVRGTPVEDISVTVLTDLGTVVHRQAQALKDLVAIAISEAASAEQITRLERVSAASALRVESVEHDRSERELMALDRLKHQALVRIRQLETEGHTYADQKAQLVEDTAQARNLAQNAELEGHEQAATGRVAELERAAVRHRDRIRALGARRSRRTSRKGSSSPSPSTPEAWSYTDSHMEGRADPTSAEVVGYARGELTGAEAERVRALLRVSPSARAVFRVARDLLVLEVEAELDSAAAPTDAVEDLLTRVRAADVAPEDVPQDTAAAPQQAWDCRLRWSTGQRRRIAPVPRAAEGAVLGGRRASMTKKTPAKRGVHMVSERVVDTPDGPMLRLRTRRGLPDGSHRDLTLTVRAYRAVAATTDTTEVLSPCGHEVPRFDLSPAFAQLVKHGGPQYPRRRLCPDCQQHPPHAALAKVAHQADDAASLQLASDWGALTKGERDAARPVLEPMRKRVRSLPDLARWTTLIPEERRQIALAGEAFAQRFGLTFRELLSLKPDPAPTISAAGLRRLKATPEEKARRRNQRADAAFRREWERQRR